MSLRIPILSSVACLLAPLTARAGANDYFVGEWVLDGKRTKPGP